MNGWVYGSLLDLENHPPPPRVEGRRTGLRIEGIVHYSGAVAPLGRRWSGAVFNLSNKTRLENPLERRWSAAGAALFSTSLIKHDSRIRWSAAGAALERRCVQPLCLFRCC